MTILHILRAASVRGRARTCNLTLRLSTELGDPDSFGQMHETCHKCSWFRLANISEGVKLS